MIAIQIKTQVVEWVQERLDTDADEAQNFAEEFVGVLYFSGAFPDSADGRLKQAAPLLLAACEAFVAWYEQDQDDVTEFVGMSEFEATIQGGDDEQLYLAYEQARAAIAAVRGEAH